MWMGGLRPLGPEETTENLNAINQLRGNAPWQLSISYGRALKKRSCRPGQAKQTTMRPHSRRY